MIRSNRSRQAAVTWIATTTLAFPLAAVASAAFSIFAFAATYYWLALRIDPTSADRIARTVWGVLGGAILGALTALAERRTSGRLLAGARFWVPASALGYALVPMVAIVATPILSGLVRPPTIPQPIQAVLFDVIDGAIVGVWQGVSLTKDARRAAGWCLLLAMATVTAGVIQRTLQATMRIESAYAMFAGGQFAGEEIIGMLLYGAVVGLMTAPVLVGWSRSTPAAHSTQISSGQEG